METQSPPSFLLTDTERSAALFLAHMNQKGQEKSTMFTRPIGQMFKMVKKSLSLPGRKSVRVHLF